MVPIEGTGPFPVSPANHAVRPSDPPTGSRLVGPPGSIEDAFMNGSCVIGSSSGLACLRRQPLSPMHSCTCNE